MKLVQLVLCRVCGFGRIDFKYIKTIFILSVCEFNKLDTTFYRLNKYKKENFNTYGMLANGITKIK